MTRLSQSHKAFSLSKGTLLFLYAASYRLNDRIDLVAEVINNLLLYIMLSEIVSCIVPLPRPSMFLPVLFGRLLRRGKERHGSWRRR